MGVLRLKDFVRAIRACKTAADERAVIAKESALIRTSFKEDSSIEARHINIAKLLYIHMLGYPAHFGQIECLKLVAGGKYADKRLGYLGIMLLLDESQEVLTLVTNSLKNDMNSSNMYAVGLALATMGNIASAEMSRDLAPEIDKLLNSSNSYVKKKAALCAVKILKKVPDLVDQFVPRAKALLNERNHSCILTGVTLIVEICKTNPQYLPEFRQLIPQLSRHLKTLITAGNSPEHDISGINDPFLQIQILQLLRVLGKGNKDASDAMNDILAQLSTNTDGSKNVGNAILYEICLTIMDIEADSGLRVLAVNTLGRFLENSDNNIRYVALNTLSKTIAVDVNAVQRHRGTVLECLQDGDISIRRRALELSYFLINESNIRVMVRELLQFLETAEQEFKISMPSRICAAADQYAPNKRWHIDTVLRVFKLAGSYVKEEVLSNFIKLVGNCPDLHSYAVYKMFYYLKQDFSQEALVLASVWCVGEYCDVLLQSAPPSKSQGEDALDEFAPSGDDIVKNVSWLDVIELLESLLKSPYNNIVTTEYVLTALTKVTVRAKQKEAEERVNVILSRYMTNIDLEVQQRSVEYITLLMEPSLSKWKAGVLDHVPVPAPVSAAERKAQQMSSNPNTPLPTDKQQLQQSGGGGGLLDDLLSLSTSPAASSAPGAGNANLLAGLGGLNLGPSSSTSPQKSAGGSNLDVLADVFGTAAQSSQPKSKNDILGLFNTSTVPTQKSPQQQPASIGGFGGLDLLGGSPPKSQPVAAADPLASLMGGGLGQPAKTMASPFSNVSSPSPITPGGGGFGASGPSETVVYSKNQLTLTFKAVGEPGPDANSRVCSIVGTFKNASAQPVTDLNLQIAVPKSFKLQLMAASGNVVPPLNNGAVTQPFKVLNPAVNTPEGKQMPVKLRLKLMYSAQNGAVKVDEIVDFPGFTNFTW